MNFIGKSVSGFAGVIACLGLAAASVNAQQAQFTLPMEAHWGKAVLEPGAYVVRFPNAADPTPILRLSGNGKSFNVMLQSRDKAEGNGTVGELILRNIDGTYVVQSISNPLTQEAYRFAMAKTHEDAASATRPQNASKVAVQIRKIGQ